MWENINCGDFINCGRLSSLLWVVLNAISQLDHNDPSKPSHRLTNGPEPSKTIESDGSNIKNHRKTIDSNGQTAQKTFNGDGLLKNHSKFAMVSSKPLKFTMVS